MGCEMIVTSNCQEAWDILRQKEGLQLGMMPHLDGPEVCHRVRAKPHLRYLYLILRTPSAPQSSEPVSSQRSKNAKSDNDKGPNNKDERHVLPF